MENAAARDSGKAAQITCLAPDVCLTPVGTAVVPVPYMIISMLSWSQTTIPTVKFTDQNAFTMASRTNKVTGDEPGVNGGVKSGVNMGWCRPQSNKSNVFVADRQLIENMNLYEMNCAGPEGPGNTIGMLIFYE
jgi:hypothetical protein